jgi:hypothetical protein
MTLELILTLVVCAGPIVCETIVLGFMLRRDLRG